MNAPAEFKVMRVRETVSPAACIDTPERAVEYWRANIPQADWFDPAKEAFVILILNTRRRIIGHNLVALGGLDSVSVSPREVLRPVLVAAGHGVIFMHNHPSNDPTPSEADIRVTRDLIRAFQIMRIEVLDHVIVGENHTSLRQLGYMNV